MTLMLSFPRKNHTYLTVISTYTYFHFQPSWLLKPNLWFLALKEIRSWSRFRRCLSLLAKGKALQMTRQSSIPTSRDLARDTTTTIATVVMKEEL